MTINKLLQCFILLTGKHDLQEQEDSIKESKHM